MELKRKVKLEGMKERTIRALLECDRIVREEYGLEVVVTSAKDQHETGKHPLGEAFDLRLPSRLVADKFHEKWDGKIHRIDKRVTDMIRERLGDAFDVILEQHQANPWNWHIHVEHDPS